jgi:hypothetical protein
VPAISKADLDGVVPEDSMAHTSTERKKICKRCCCCFGVALLLYALLIGVGLLLLANSVGAMTASVKSSLQFSAVGDLCAEAVALRLQAEVESGSFLGVEASAPLRLVLFDPEGKIHRVDPNFAS